MSSPTPTPTPTAPGPSSPGGSGALHGGAVAGIAVGVAAFVVLTALPLSFMCYRHQRAKRFAGEQRRGADRQRGDEELQRGRGKGKEKEKGKDGQFGEMA
ncbi:hypothetical protein ESCO_001964 [Escovopsis weberi]|uniref:Uncharacterized protein n=1 Tax=Escovopsis weberi TaxID=150374 RepID=A0A0M9VWH8_ESCWE|nr:hypothetical protein ESCO_001964 [Escovopsis weberi]